MSLSGPQRASIVPVTTGAERRIDAAALDSSTAGSGTRDIDREDDQHSFGSDRSDQMGPGASASR